MIAPLCASTYTSCSAIEPGDVHRPDHLAHFFLTISLIDCATSYRDERVLFSLKF
jgi:hypothetical protein